MGECFGWSLAKQKGGCIKCLAWGTTCKHCSYAVLSGVLSHQAGIHIYWVAKAGARAVQQLLAKWRELPDAAPPADQRYKRFVTEWLPGDAAQPFIQNPGVNVWGTLSQAPAIKAKGQRTEVRHGYGVGTHTFVLAYKSG